MKVNELKDRINTVNEHNAYSRMFKELQKLTDEDLNDEKKFRFLFSIIEAWAQEYAVLRYEQDKQNVLDIYNDNRLFKEADLLDRVYF